MKILFRHLQARISILLAKIHQIMSGEPSDPSILSLLPHKTFEDSIRTWCGNAVVSENVGYARKAKVVGIIHTKSGNRKNHEAITFEIVIDDKTSYILTDRNSGSGKSSSSSSPSTSNVDLTTPASSSPAAYDRIIVPSYGLPHAIDSYINDTHSVVCSFQIPPNTTFSLAELAGLLPLVSAQSEQYSPFAKQCYWYARAVYESVKMRYPPHEEKMGPEYSNRGKHAKYVPIPCHVSKGELETIKTLWLSRIEHISKVETMSELLTSRYVAEEGRQAAEGRAHTAEEEKQAAESRARTAEEKLEAIKREAEEKLEAMKRAWEEERRALLASGSASGSR
jgi:hypothetical protein